MKKVLYSIDGPFQTNFHRQKNFPLNCVTSSSRAPESLILDNGHGSAVRSYRMPSELDHSLEILRRNLADMRNAIVSNTMDLQPSNYASFFTNHQVVKTSALTNGMNSIPPPLGLPLNIDLLQYLMKRYPSIGVSEIAGKMHSVETSDITSDFERQLAALEIKQRSKLINDYFDWINRQSHPIGQNNLENLDAPKVAECFMNMNTSFFDYLITQNDQQTRPTQSNTFTIPQHGNATILNQPQNPLLQNECILSESDSSFEHLLLIKNQQALACQLPQFSSFAYPNISNGDPHAVTFPNDLDLSTGRRIKSARYDGSSADDFTEKKNVKKSFWGKKMCLDSKEQTYPQNVNIVEKSKKKHDPEHVYDERHNTKVKMKKSGDLIGTSEHQPKCQKKWKRPADMPRRPLSAYNFFFSDERKRILKSIPDDKTDTIVVSSSSSNDVEKHFSVNTDRLLSLGRVVEKRPRRPHRKTHGKIGFKSLAKLIGKRWQELPMDKRERYHKLALVDLKRYSEQMHVYNIKRNI